MKTMFEKKSLLGKTIFPMSAIFFLPLHLCKISSSGSSISTIYYVIMPDVLSVNSSLEPADQLSTLSWPGATNQKSTIFIDS